MSKQPIPPKPDSLQTTNDKGLDDAACYASIRFEALDNYGWTIKEAFAAKRAYESWSGEIITEEDMEYAIKGGNDRSGLFAQRISAFFAGFSSNLNT
jgi:hypothetical protein